MKNALGVTLAICFTFSLPLAAQGFSPEQLDNLLAPVALYPDPLLAQVLTASTFEDQVEVAARMVRARANPRFIDAQPWDVSVKAVAHYPRVLFMMAEKPDWTIAVGQAYINQSSDVMAGIQRMRVMARNQGNLVSNPNQEVIVNGGYIAIDPIQPGFLFVPAYDPGVVFFRRGLNFVTFGAGLAIGAWLVYDFNWGHGLFYHGWGGPGFHGGWNGGWIGRSRGVVEVNNRAYVNDSFRDIHVNREIVHRNVNYANLNHFNAVHHDAAYGHAAGHEVAAHPAANHPGGPAHPAGAHAGAAPAHTAAAPGHAAHPNGAPAGQHPPAGKPAGAGQAQHPQAKQPQKKPAEKPQQKPGAKPEHEKK